MALLVLGFVRCGGDDICLNCEAVPTPTPGPRDVITVKGSINSLSTFDDISDVVVIACFDLDPALVAPEDFNNCPAFTKGSPDADRNFNLTNNLSLIDQDQADIRVAFWISQQNPKVGTIMDGDLFSELTEVSSQVQNLRDVRLGWTAAINPVDVDFTTVAPGVAAGVATTDRIAVTITPTATPTPAPTPEP